MTRHCCSWHIWWP